MVRRSEVRRTTVRRATRIDVMTEYNVETEGAADGLRRNKISVPGLRISKEKRKKLLMRNSSTHTKQERH